jgi:hypothetical protein
MRAPIISALESEIRRIVREELRALLGQSRADEYSSSDLPPSIRTAKAFARICRGLPEARQDGARGPWRVSREAWHRARDRRPPVLHLVANSDDEDLRRALDAARGGRR